MGGIHCKGYGNHLRYNIIYFHYEYQMVRRPYWVKTHPFYVIKLYFFLDEHFKAQTILMLTSFTMFLHIIAKHNPNNRREKLIFISQMRFFQGIDHKFVLN